MIRSTTIIRELALNLAKFIFMLKHSVKLLRYMLFGDVAACCMGFENTTPASEQTADPRLTSTAS